MVKTLRPAHGNNFMLFMILFSIFVGVLIEVPFIILGIDPENMDPIFLNNIFQIVGLFLPFLLFFAVTKHRFTEVIPIRLFSLGNGVLIIAMTLCLQPAAVFIGEISAFFFGSDVNNYIGQMLDRPFYVLVITSCVIPAVFEELLTRGVVLGCYKGVGIKKAAVMNGLFFGILHMSLEQFFYAFMFGIALAYFVYYTRSILASMFAHFSVNFSQMALAHAEYKSFSESGGNLEEYLAEPTPDERIYTIVSFFLFAVIFMAVFRVLFSIFAGYNKRRNAAEDITGDYAAADEVVFPNKISTWSLWALIAVFLIFTVTPYLGRI